MKVLRDVGLSVVLTLAAPIVILAIYAGYSMLGDPWGNLVMGAVVFILGAAVLYYLVLATKLGTSVARLRSAAKNPGPNHG
ncbi:hypothetical protein [Sphingomonas sp.]|uniref:hypothetical protein n=1 Tax=Sphingomonas sp. TaxID=28214 RepID=UPI002E1072AD|nr:hypothetical protein [Sphingomonas sp.]